MNLLHNTAVSSATTSSANCCADQASYLIRFEDNHESLADRINELRRLKNHVMSRVEADEVNEMTRTPVVEIWLQRVLETGQEVDFLLRESSEQIQYIGCCCLRNWWRCYMLGKKVSKKLPVVEELIRKGNFDIVADRSLPSSVQVMPESNTVGMDAIFHKAWKLLGEKKVNVLGIYGMGGVGKTTLLKRIHNAFAQIAQNVDVVIWVVVSKDFSLPNVQANIGNRLGLTWSADEGKSEKAQRIFNVLRQKKFVLMLDDIWQHLDLEAIGVPFPNDGVHYSNSKVVFTTRSESVCRSMEVNELVKMSTLDWDQAWILFQQKVGPGALASHPEIPNLAAEVAKQCGGLPLALITIGRAMATKTTLGAWKFALKTLKNSASEFSGMEEEVLAPLKFSYDSLKTDAVRNCFLYFSLHPKDDDIEKYVIVRHWIAEGFLDQFEDYYDAFDKGHDIIGSLKIACLLEGSMLFDEMVVMHDLVRDMALWIACKCEMKKNKYLVQANVGLTEAPNVENWKDAQRISLMDNDIKELREAPECPYLQTLFLQRNLELSNIAVGFFQYMPNLTVLVLSRTRITEVPKSIGYLVELRHLDLSYTRIQTLPDEVGNLTKLRLLDLDNSIFLTNIPQGMISKFSKLQSLNLERSGIFGADDDICYPSAAELECLEHLRDLGTTVRDLLTLESMCFSPRLRLCLMRLTILRCHGLTQMDLVPSLLFGETKRLDTISIEYCSELKEVRIGYVKEDKLLLSLRFLYFFDLPKMNIIWNNGLLCFNNLAYVYIFACDALKDISWLVRAPVLLNLKICECREVEDILVKNHDIALSKLEHLELIGLPKLASISRVSLPLPSLKKVRVFGCPLLKKLPFTSNSTKKPFLKICGEKKWWNQLEWEEETVKSSFQAFFK